MLEKLKFWEREVEEELSKEVSEISDKIDNLLHHHHSSTRQEFQKAMERTDSKRFKQMSAIIQNQEVLEEKISKTLDLLEKVNEGQKQIPNKMLNEIQELQDLKNELIPRKMVEIIERNEGRMQSGKLLKECREKDICSKSIFYQYINKMVYKGMTSSPT